MCVVPVWELSPERAQARAACDAADPIAHSGGVRRGTENQLTARHLRSTQPLRKLCTKKKGHDAADKELYARTQSVTRTGRRI